MKIKNILKGFLTVVLFSTILNFSAAEDVNVYVKDYLINSSSTWVNVPFDFNASKGFASMDFWIYYNENILNITDFSKIQKENGFAGACNRQGAGKWKCSLYQSSGIDIQGNISVVSINFSVLGGCGVKSNIGVGIDYIQNSSYHVLTYSVINGSVTIKCDGCICPSGTTCNTTTHLCQATTSIITSANEIVDEVNISVGDYLVDPDISTITVPINISNCSGMGSGHFEIYYNGFTGSGTNPKFNPLNAPSVVDSGNYVGVNSFISQSYPVIDVQFGMHKPNTGCVLANINFNINTTQVGKRSDIYINVKSLKDPSSNNLDYVTSNGSITIMCNSTNCPSGMICNTTTHLCQSNTTTTTTPQPTIVVGNYITNPGGNVSVIVNVTGAPKIQAYSFNITYDPTVVTPTSVVNAGFADVTSNLNYSYGKVYVTADSVAGKTGNFSLFIINFSANNGVVGKISPIAIEVENFGNSSGDIPYVVQNGSIIVKYDGYSCGANSFCNTTTHLCQSTAATTTTITCYRDADGDGYGNASNTTTTTNTACPSGYVNNSQDCNDNNNTIHPGATDIPNNGIDENCNGHDNITCYADLDNDNYTNNTNIVHSDNGCPANYKNSSAEQDCNDNNSTINPGVNETKTECKFGYYLSRTLNYEFDSKISDIQIYDVDKDGTDEIITTTTEYDSSCGNSAIKIFKNNHGNLVEIWNTTMDGDIVFKFADIDNDNKSEIIVKSVCQNYYNRDNNKYKIYVYDDSTLNFTKLTEIDLKIYAPDLIFTGINFSKANISHNDNITITLKILNNGSTNAVNARVELNIINNLKNFYVTKYLNLSAHTETTTEFNWTATFGKNEISGEIDSRNKIAEINESNNKIYSNLTVIDSNPPHIIVISPANNSIINGNLLEFSITDDISVDKVRYAINNGNFNKLPYPYYITTTNLSSGKYNIVIVANDTSGNSANATFYFIVDSTPPTVKFSMPEHIYINESANIEIPADVDDDSAIKEVYAEIYFDNVVSQSSLNYDRRSSRWRGNFEGKVGYYTIKIVAIDTLGNINDSEIAEFDVSKILNTTIKNSTIIASIIENSELKNSEIIASVVNDSFLNYTSTNLSEIEKVSSENSKFDSSVLFRCNAINSTIIRTDIKSSRMLGSTVLFYPTFVNATIVDGVLINGSIFDSRINAIGEKIGAKPGAKIGAKAGARIGGMVGAKIGAKIGARISAKIGARIPAKIGAKIGAKDGLDTIIGDTDKDGKKEIISVMNQIYIFENDGNNNFVKIWNSNTIDGIISEILINDSDNDGNLEIITSAYNKIYIFENTGDNAYAEISTYSGIGEISNLIVDDLNNDGKNEILFRDSKGIHILENNGSKFSEISNYSIYVDNLWIDDLNNDGKKEIIYYKREWIDDRCVYSYYYEYYSYSCGHYKITIGILGNDGNNQYSKISDETIPEDVWINNMFFDDLNNDGIKEILIAGDKIYILESTGNNSYVKTYDSGNEIKYIQKILFKDIDNDSKKELVVLSYENYWGGKNEISIYKINECDGIFVSETTERQQYSKGEEFNYTITVKAINFTNITIKDNLSECIEFIGSNLASEVQNGTYIWKVNSGIHRLNLKVRAKEDCEGNVVNNVFVKGEKEGFDFSSSAQASVYIEPPQIILQQYPYWQWHRPEDNNGLSSITIPIKVQGKLRNVSVIDILPNGSRFLNASLIPKISDNKLIWNLGDMENEEKTINLTMDFPNVSNAWAYNYVYVRGQHSNGIAEHSGSAIIRIGDYIDPVWVFVEPIKDTRLPNDTVKFNITTILEANTTTRNVETLFTLPPELKLITATGNFTIIKTDKTTLKWHVEGPFESGVNTTFTYEIIAKISGNTSPKILTVNVDTYSDVVDKIEESHTNSIIIIPFCNGNCSASEFCNKTINKCMPKKNNNNACNVSEECTSNNCFDGICRPAGWECNNDSDCSANLFCNNEHKCQIKSNSHKSSNTYRNEGGTQIITLTQTQQVTANNTAKTNETNKSKPEVAFNKSVGLNVSKEENNAKKDKDKILEEANHTETSQKETSQNQNNSNKNNSNNEPLLIVLIAITTSIVAMLLLLKMNKRKK